MKDKAKSTYKKARREHIDISDGKVIRLLKELDKSLSMFDDLTATI